MDKKNTMLLTVIAVATLLVAVVGATFAFFTADNTASGTTTVTTTTEKVGSVTVTNPTSEMHLTLAAADMDEASKGTSYWATKTPGTAYVTAAEHNPVANLKIDGGVDATVYNCSFNLNISKPSLVQSGDAALVLTLTDATAEGVTSGTEIDLATAAESYKVEFTHTGDVESKDLVTAAVKYNNTTFEQDYLAGQTLTVSVSNSDLTCTIQD